MRCDIHCFGEKLVNGKYECLESALFYKRYYNIFAFLADEKNSSDITPIPQPRGLPLDVSDFVKSEHEIWAGNNHHDSWLLIKELQEANYDVIVDDPYTNTKITLKEFLGDYYFKELERISHLDRIVFWFD